MFSLLKMVELIASFVSPVHYLKIFLIRILEGYLIILEGMF